jgi:hypothetical protein
MQDHLSATGTVPEHLPTLFVALDSTPAGYGLCRNEEAPSDRRRFRGRGPAHRVARRASSTTAGRQSDRLLPSVLVRGLCSRAPEAVGDPGLSLSSPWKPLSPARPVLLLT